MNRWRATSVALILGAAALAARQRSPLPALPADVPADARRDTKIGDREPGRLVVWRDSVDLVEIVYQVARAGCVVDIRSLITIDAVGVPIRLQHTGRNCDPARTVNERYWRDGATGTWQSRIANGSADTVGKKFYLSADGTPEERAMLVRVLLASGNTVALLPEGRARLERVGEVRVTSGGREEALIQYRIHGADAAPSAVWLDRRGDLFALAPDLIKEGWESAAPQLIAVGK